MIRILYDDKKSSPRLVGDVQELPLLLANKQSVIWVHLQGRDEAEVKSMLQDVFCFHHLAVEDTISTGYQPPKVDDFETYLFIIVHALMSNGDVSQLETEELNLFLGPNYVVTVTQHQIKPIERMHDVLQRNERIFNRGPDFVAHAILDAIVDEFLPFLDRIDDEVDYLEDAIIMKPEPKSLRRILELKHSILALRRVASPQREVMLRLSRGEFSQTLISRKSQIYFRDIYDHLVRIADLSEGVRDIVGGTLDTYLSVSSNKLNEVMKALTIVSTIFLPLTLVTSLYGMNFEFMPELHWRYGYLMVWIIMIGIIVGMLWFFRRRRWI